MRTRMEALEIIKTHLPYGIGPGTDFCEDTTLEAIGVTSVHLITMLLTLERTHSVSIHKFAVNGMPTTVGDLVTQLSQAPPRDDSEG